VADDAWRPVEFRGQLSQVHARGQERIDDRVPVVRLVPAPAQRPVEPQLAKRTARRRQPEAQHLDGQGRGLAQMLDPLRRLHQIHPSRRSPRGNLLSRHRPAPPLDHPHRRVHLVGAVEEMVDALDSLHRHQAEAEPPPQLFRRLAGRDAPEVHSLGGGPARQRLDRPRRRAPRSQAHGHAGADLFHRRLRECVQAALHQARQRRSSDRRVRLEGARLQASAAFLMASAWVG
jgi:hypothetical protein